MALTNNNGRQLEQLQDVVIVPDKTSAFNAIGCTVKNLIKTFLGRWNYNLLSTRRRIATVKIEARHLDSLSCAITWGKKVDAMYHFCLSVFSLVVTLLFYFLSVGATGATVSIQERTKGALQIVGQFLRDDIGSTWLTGESKDRLLPLTIEQLMRQIMNSTEFTSGVVEAAGVIALALEHERITTKINESQIVKPEVLKEFLDMVADRDDVLCFYRKRSLEADQRASDWERIMKHVPTHYSTSLALDTGYQYVLCMKKKLNESASTEGIGYDESTEVSESAASAGGGASSAPAMDGETNPESYTTVSTSGPPTASTPEITSASTTAVLANDLRKSLANAETMGQYEAVSKTPSAEDCGSDSTLCASSPISASGEFDSASVESPGSDEEESEDEGRLMRDGAGGNDESGSTGKDGTCGQTFQCHFHHHRLDNSIDYFRNYIKNRRVPQGISNRVFGILRGNTREKSSYYALYICPFDEIRRQIKPPEIPQFMNIPSPLRVHNESPEVLLNLPPQYPPFVHNEREFIEYLHDNDILTDQHQSKHRNRNRNEYWNSMERSVLVYDVGPLSLFPARQLMRGDLHRATMKEIALGPAEEKNLVKMLLNGAPQEPVKLSIYTNLNPEIEVYRRTYHYPSDALTHVPLKMYEQSRGSLAVHGVDKSITQVGEIEEEDCKTDIEELMNLSRIE